MEEISIEELDFNRFFEDTDEDVLNEMGVQPGRINQNPSVYYVEGEDPSPDLNIESLFDGCRVSDVLEYTENHAKSQGQIKQEVKKGYFEERMESIAAARENHRRVFEDRNYLIGEVHKLSRYQGRSFSGMADISDRVEARIQSRAKAISDARIRVQISRIYDALSR